jgi:NFU1 iron-sulfur cluster scaffold homolog, mitochondrial
VKGVYICNNFITVTKEYNFEWESFMLEMKSFIKKYIQDGGTIVKEGFETLQTQEQKAKEAGNYAPEDAEIVEKIKNLIDKYVRPAVEMDGGNIAFKSFNNGIVSVLMQGSCSGCPSSTQTLKGGIEGMMKRMIPQVKEVVAIAG